MSRSRSENPACRSVEHVVSRRSLLAGLGGVAGLGGLAGPGLGLCGGLAATPAIADGEIYLRGKNTLYLIRQK